MNNFSQLGLSDALLKVVEQIGFEQPTPVQEKAIPLLLEKNPTDFIGLAQTGTGKTAAFGLPLIDLIDAEYRNTQALIMAPTRELGQQTAAQLVSFAKNIPGLNVEVVYGGAAIANQIRALKKPTQILVATPGRLLDLINRKAVNLEAVRYVVLDEADEMLNMGFKEDIDAILEHTNFNRVTWLFSATMPPEIRKIVKKYMEDPIEVAVNTEQKSNVDISHKYVMTKNANKLPAIKRFLDIQPEMRGILFCRTKRETQQIADDLGNMGYGVEALHGDLSQGQRDAVMRRFKNRSMQLLIATDVAARGIDVDNLTHVLHHQLPDQLENYTHRSGRTGRAGKKGLSLAFINPREGYRIKDLEKRVKIEFERIEVPSVEELRSSRINNWANLIINTDVDEQAESILKSLKDRFEELSKEDILKRLITSQLDHITVQGKEDADLNEASGKRSDREESRSRGNSGFKRYFVNIGSIDGLTKGDLIHFLADVSEIDRRSFGQITMQKNCAFFDIKDGEDKDLAAKFKGIHIDGRSIRVNLDDEGPKRTGGGGGGGGYHNKGVGKFRKPQGGGFKRTGGKRKRY